MPMFTVIVPTHDRPVLLQRTLQSLIAQTCQDFKVVIVSDSGSYLPPYQELTRFDQRFDYVLRCSGKPGPAASRDLGVAISDGEYILFLDDDDTYRPDHLEKLKARLLLDRPELLFCDLQIQNEDRTTNPPTLLEPAWTISIAGATAASIYVRNQIPNSCVAYRRDVVVGLRNDPSMIIYEDWDFLLSALAGRQLVHFATDGVVIHKSKATAPENMRRGNSRDDLTIETMLHLYRKHAAPDMATRLARQALMLTGGIELDLSHF